MIEYIHGKSNVYFQGFTKKLRNELFALLNASNNDGRINSFSATWDLEINFCIFAYNHYSPILFECGCKLKNINI